MSANPVHAVVDAEGKIAAWYIVQPENVERIPVPARHVLIEIDRKPNLGETHVDLETGQVVVFNQEGTI
jgi:hypothetical protein